MTTISEDLDLVVPLHENPALLPWGHIEKSFYRILSVMMVITVVQMVLLTTFSHVSAKGGACGDKTTEKTEKDPVDPEKAKSLRLWKASYQATNLLVNLFLGCFGIYHVICTIPSTSPVTEKIEGREEMSIFADLQIGYQLWAIPVGIFFVNESSAMLGHHVAVIVVSSLAAFFTNGFRYYIPFFFGLIEISSVPLSIMNTFKNNESWIKKYPGIYSAIRIIFAVSFLTCRVIMWLPRIVDFLRLCMIMIWSCHDGSCRAALGSTAFAASVLTFLQLLWASKIVEGLLKGGKKKSTKKE